MNCVIAIDDLELHDESVQCVWQPRTGYEKPMAKKQENMTFMARGLPKLGAALACRQCSSCHGCR